MRYFLNKRRICAAIFLSLSAAVFSAPPTQKITPKPAPIITPAIMASINKTDFPPPLPKPVNIRFCLFDPMGPTGKISQTAKELIGVVKAWNLIVDLKIYSNERVATEDFKAGQCDAAAVSTLRAKQFNFTVGSIDAPGNLRSNAEIKSLLTQLANPVLAALAINGRYQVAAVIPIGALYVFVNDKRINSIEKAAGKRVVVLEWDKSQARMISAIGARPVPADFTNYGATFNSGEADIIAAPTMAYLPMELHKGIGKAGGVIRFPLLQASASVLLRRDLMLPKIPDLDLRLAQLRKFGLRYLEALFAFLKEADRDIPPKLWIDLNKTDQEKYYAMLREARIHLTHEGTYDPVMMSLLKRIRCQSTPTDAECATFDE